jgi:hypothetical protein
MSRLEEAWMMARSLAIVAVLWLGTTVASAQYYPPNARGRFNQQPSFTPYAPPTLSPYLNLLRGGNTASNYYLGVVPDRYQRNANMQFQGAIQQLNRREDALEEGEPPPVGTGHAAQFMNYTPYYFIPGGARFNPSNTLTTQTLPQQLPARKR